MLLHVLIALFAPKSLTEYHSIVIAVTARATVSVTAVEADATVAAAAIVNGWCSCPFSYMLTRACSVDTLRLTERQLYFVIRNRNGSH